MRKLLIDDATGLVVNAIDIEEEATWSPPPGYSLVDDDPSADIGYTHTGGGIFEPPEPPEPTPRELRLAELAVKLRGRTATTAEIQEFLVTRLDL